MTPDEASPGPVDDRLLARFMACDSLLHGSHEGPGRDASASPRSTDDDDRARGRLLLLLRMLDASEPSTDPTGVEEWPGLPTGSASVVRSWDASTSWRTWRRRLRLRGPGARPRPGPRGGLEDAAARAAAGAGDVRRFLLKARASAAGPSEHRPGVRRGRDRAAGLLHRLGVLPARAFGAG